MARTRDLLMLLLDKYIFQLYLRLKDNPTIKWKERIKRIAGIDVSTEAVLDV